MIKPQMLMRKSITSNVRKNTTKVSNSHSVCSTEWERGIYMKTGFDKINYDTI